MPIYECPQLDQWMTHRDADSSSVFYLLCHQKTESVTPVETINGLQWQNQTLRPTDIMTM